MDHMKTVTIRQVRHDFSSVLAWVTSGNEVTVLNRKRPVARICPLPVLASDKKVTMPDFAARAKRIFGDAPPIPNVVLEEREQYQW